MTVNVGGGKRMRKTRNGTSITRPTYGNTERKIRRVGEYLRVLGTLYALNYAAWKDSRDPYVQASRAVTRTVNAFAGLEVREPKPVPVRCRWCHHHTVWHSHVLGAGCCCTGCLCLETPSLILGSYL